MTRTRPGGTCFPWRSSIILGRQHYSDFFIDGRKDYPINHGATMPDNFLMVIISAENVVCITQSGFNVDRMLPKFAKVLWPEIQQN